MSKNITLILFLSEYRGYPEAEYTTDQGFTVSGAQTNEAPLRYTVKRLSANGEKITRIIALVTPKARETALEKFKQTVSAVTPGTALAEIKISDNVMAADLLRDTLDVLLPVLPDDRVS